MHPRLREITAELSRVRAELAAVIETTPEERLARDPGGERWSGLRIIEHLGKTEGSIAKMFEGLFASALADGLPADSETSSLLGSLDHLRIVDRSRRIAAPERLVPSPLPELGPSWESLQRVRVRTLAAVATVDGRDLSQLSAPHPIFGPIDGYQWVLFVGQHEERHLHQLREVLGAS
jgi:hypothetical protein